MATAAARGIAAANAKKEEREAKGNEEAAKKKKDKVTTFSIGVRMYYRSGLHVMLSLFGIVNSQSVNEW